MLTLLGLLLSNAHAGCDTPRRVRVVTLNAWGLPAPIAKDRKLRLPRIERWLEKRDADISGLQEVWRGARPLLSDGVVWSASPADTGLAVSSRHPVTHLVQHTFASGRGFDRIKSKGVLEVELEVQGEPLWVAVTHLQSGPGERNARVRAAQVDELLELVEPGRPTVLLGDFNFYTGELTDALSHQRLVDAGFVDVAAAAGVRTATYPGGEHRFDRIYARSRCTHTVDAEVIEDSGLSDHHAVEVELRL
ncbi:MAG: endonuclease/exonuclease/phosphatase family protein [Myxococcales bacterium]|nr:endonuclease/exonuclease/phosphatase family protein [Myxococcales bacterium]